MGDRLRTAFIATVSCAHVKNFVFVISASHEWRSCCIYFRGSEKHTSSVLDEVAACYEGLFGKVIPQDRMGSWWMQWWWNVVDNKRLLFDPVYIQNTARTAARNFLSLVGGKKTHLPISYAPSYYFSRVESFLPFSSSSFFFFLRVENVEG
jgi:hypothetical protein